VSVYVVDACVAAKWVLEEEWSSEATRLLDTAHYLHAPDFIDLELDHILCKRIRRNELTVEEAEEVREIMKVFPIQKYSFAQLQDHAFAMASTIRRGIYGCLYLTLARLLDVQMVTADKKLQDALVDGPWEQIICWIGDLPDSSPE
jgi:predicted nucleic acid-binding protein